MPLDGLQNKSTTVIGSLQDLKWTDSEELPSPLGDSLLAPAPRSLGCTYLLHKIRRHFGGKVKRLNIAEITT